MPPSTAIAKTRPMNSRPIDGSTGSSTSSKRPRCARKCDGDGESDALQANRVRAHEAQSRRVLGDAQNCAANECALQKKLRSAQDHQRPDEGNHFPKR